MAEGESSKPAKGAGTVAWRYRDFRLSVAARFLGVMGGEAQAVGVAWQVYQLTRSPLALGCTGLALFLPGIFFTLPSGHVSDRFERRKVVLCCYLLQFAATALLLWISLAGVRSIWPVYAVLFVIGTGRCFSGPAMSAMMPNLLPKEHFVNAVTWSSTIFQIANATGPMVGGLLFTVTAGRWSGAPLVYGFTLACLAVYWVLIWSIRPQPVGDGAKKAFGIDTMLEGLRYVLSTRLLLGAISLDLFAVLLGGAVSLMPVFAAEVLHTGSRGLGVLRAAPSAGALVVSLSLAFRPIRRQAGRTMLTCVGIFGAATVVFGLSRSMWLSCVALLVVGASDMVSVVVRQTILQMATPDAMRGRVSSVSWLFVGASNEFGEFESGVTAQWMGAVRAVVVGGVASLMVTGLWSVFFPTLRKVDRLETEDLLAVEQGASAVVPAGGAEPME